MISKRGFLMLTASALLASTFAAPPPPKPGHHGRHLPPGAKWCSKCGGDGYNRAWYGAKRFCHICDGKGWIMVAPPPPPPRGVHHPGPKGGHPGPVGKPGPGPKGGPR